MQAFRELLSVKEAREGSRKRSPAQSISRSQRNLFTSVRS